MAKVELPKNKWVLLLVVVLFLQTFCTAILAVDNHDLNKRLDSASDSLFVVSKTLAKSNAENTQLTISQRVVVDAVNSTVYLPEFRIKLPYDETSKALAYSIRNYDKNGKIAVDASNAEADLTSLNYVHPAPVTTMDCSDLLRIKVELTQKPYNPHEKASTVKLADGRSLQLYEPVNLNECEQSWNISASPDTVLTELKQAQSY
jgi:hypothetical protein